MRVGIFLDGGGAIGWAVMGFAPGVPLVHRGTFYTKSRGRGVFGARLIEVDEWLQGMIVIHRPLHIAFESPLPHTGFKTGKRDPMSNRFTACVAGKFEEVAFRNNIDCSEAAPSSIKLALAGNGRATKEEMEAAAKARGYDVSGKDEADACGVGVHCINNYFRGLSDAHRFIPQARGVEIPSAPASRTRRP